MKNKSSGKKPYALDLLVLAVLPLLATLTCWLLPIGFLVSSLLFFGLPAAYLSWRQPTRVKRAFIFACSFAIPGGIVWDYFAEKDGSWFIPTLFPFKIFGLVTVEAIVWALSISYLVVIFYDYFFDHRKHAAIGKNMRYMFLLFFGMFILFCIFFGVPHYAPALAYTYLWGGLALLGFPLFAFAISFPRFLSSLLKTVPYFFSLAFLEEIVALHKGYWSFPGTHFIGWINLSGGYRFPIEELLFWLIICSAAIISYYEFFDDNHVKWNAIKLHR